VFFGHHHPSYTGGLRAFIAAGALVHAPAHSAQFVEHLAALPFQLTPDRLARRNVPPRIEPFTGNIELRDDRGAVIEAIDIGKESNHTDEYVVFYLPRHKLLFQGDLGWYAEPNGPIRASRRAPGLLRVIAARGLVVDTLVQSWPVMGTKQQLTLSELEAAVRARATQE
jgi:glyoxylase-like metal-dependent hydrolase (beta-lactamase superfamily II)